MVYKRILLIVLLVFAIASLFIIVYFARNRMGIFSKSYDSFISNKTMPINAAIVSNLKDVGTEVTTLANEKLVKNIFFSQAMGDDIRQYIPQFEEIRKHIKSCNKIQLIDSFGAVNFSTVETEIITKKIKDQLLTEIKTHFSQTKDPYYYFLNNIEFISILPIYETSGDTSPQGYLFIYYKTDRLLTGITEKDLIIPFSADNYLFLASKQVDTNTINKIINYYDSQSSQKSKEEAKGTTIGVISRLMGLKIVHMAKDDHFLPWEAILFIIINIILLGLLVFALVQTGREATEEHYYIPKAFSEEERFSDMQEDIEEEAVAPSKKFSIPSNEEIEDLVDDIERNETYSKSEASNGIERMIMTSSDSLTEMPIDEKWSPSEDELPSSMYEAPGESDFTPEDYGSASAGEEASIPEWDEPEMPGEIAAPDFNEPVVSGESAVPEWNEPSFDEFSQPAMTEEQPSSTQMFAEQERILQGVEDNGEFSAAPAGEDFSFDMMTEPGEAAPESNEPVFDMLSEDDNELIGEETIEMPGDAGIQEVSDAEIEPHMESAQADEFAFSEEMNEGDIKQEDIMAGMGDIEENIVSFDENSIGQLDELETSENPMTSPEISLTDIGQDAPEFDMGAMPAEETPEFDMGAMPAEETPEFDMGGMQTEETPEFDMGGVQTEETPEFDMGTMPAEETPEFDMGAMPTEETPEFDMGGGQTEEIPEFEIPTEPQEDLSQYEVDAESSNGMAQIDIPSETPMEMDEFEIPLETAPESEPEGGIPASASIETPENENMLEGISSGMEIPEFDIDSMIADVPDTQAADDDDSITLDMNELAAIDVEMADDNGPVEPMMEDNLVEVEEPLDVPEFDMGESQDEQGTFDEPMMTEQPKMDNESSFDLPEGQEIPEFDLDAMIMDVPSAETASEDDDSITLDMSELSAIDLDLEEEAPAPEASETIPEFPVEPSGSIQEIESPTELTSSVQDIEPHKPIDFNKVFMEPPVKISTIGHVESYADVAMDLAANNLNFGKISVVKKSGEEFGELMNQGFKNEMSFSMDDPIYIKYLSRKKSVDIRGDLTKAKYLTDRFDIDDLAALEEIMIVPVIKGDEIKGIGVYGREKGKKEPTHFQKSELYNLGFLQEE
ncbi:MAG: hypothetical protein HPY53_10945 [Brevinematales bacterium]|nr:hypothetical protein [Brevinematales bacterium]